MNPPAKNPQFALGLRILAVLLAVSPLPSLLAADSPEKRAEALLSQMTPEEKIDYISGTNSFYIREIPRLKLPAIKLSDGPMAARNDGQTTSYPAGIALAATFDPAMATKIGIALGRDCRARGVNILLGPAVNIYRSPLCGRNFEYLGEDPFLAATLVAPEIQGIQSQGVLATVKHFACNNQEWERNRMSAEVDERTLQEIYLPAFKAAVQQGHAGSVMMAYNLLNGVHCAESDYLMNQVLKHDWGFTGFVMSDWSAVHDGINSANTGMDLEMPSGRYMNRQTLLPALASGKVKQTDIDDKVRRILRTIIAAGFLDRPQKLDDINLNDPANQKTALEGARESIVLLKNEKHTLPLDRKTIKTIAVIGPNAHPAIYGGGGSALARTVFGVVSIRDGVSNVAGAKISVLSSTNSSNWVALAKSSDAAVVCVGFNPRSEQEGRDRTFDLPVEQVDLIKAVTAVNPHTIVVINSGGGVAWEGWLDKTPAVLQAWYSGVASGQAVAEILFGDVNPSGKLPATFEKKWADNPTAASYHLRIDTDGRAYTNGIGQVPATAIKTPYTEGIFVGYRGYDENKIEPQFCFGHGLSYTEFKYDNLKLSAAKISADGSLTVNVDVKNTGKLAGDEVVQLYVHQQKSSVKQPQKELKGFERVSLKPGEKKTVSLTLTKDQLAFYDVKTHGWLVEPGAFDIMVGGSSRDIHGTTKFEVTASRK